MNALCPPPPTPSPTEYTPLSPEDIQALRLKAERGELTAADTRAFIMSTRAAFTAMPTKAPAKKKQESEAAKKLPPASIVDFF